MSWLQLALKLLGLTRWVEGWIDRKAGERVGELRRENRELKEQARILKAQRDSLVVPPPQNPFSDSKF